MDFQLQRMETIYDQAGGLDDVLHRHAYYTVILVEEAKGTHLIDFKEYIFGHQEIHFVSPGQVHRVALESRPKGWAITFSRDFLIENNIPENFVTNIKLFQTFDESPPLKLDNDDFIRLQNVIHEMDSCLLYQLKYRTRALGALLQLFLIYCNNSLNEERGHLDEESREICLLRDFKTLVDDKFMRWHKVREYAHHLNVTPKHLSQTIKEVNGRTAKEYIQERLALEARRLLIHTGKSVKEIAFQLGFNEAVHFSAFFKNLTGISPTEFRHLKS